jgi:hypothetical protein
VKQATLRHYTRDATELIQTLGEDAGQWTSQAVRNFLLEHARQCGGATTQQLITSLRALLRYLNFQGETRDDLALAIPAIAHWRLAKLPRCLSTQEVNRLIAACTGTDPRRLRDRVLSKKSIVLPWAILKWSVQSNRYGDISISGCRSIPGPIVHQQSRLECSEFQAQRSMRHHVSRSKVELILRQPCGRSSSAARRDVPADALRLGGPHA